MSGLLIQRCGMKRMLFRGCAVVKAHWPLIVLSTVLAVAYPYEARAWP